ncbi:sigma-70 family RNA polymerase sigma factor [Aeoliella sp. ICT_H6.2]|uniref:Sigma-70 family RNA polymerase sigma factor n=1 Tax=Aeoliella straminimaris TaxID=2954799 RepID=A0A9X2JIL9_9BACT|nr:sigma-70 family RNA polymerase sigma factor [Aeoliella straminimaris]MCO6044069.1 sigma-70 family RNA polymerase sigma factor [Aeoliella straminimaris]
MDASNSSDSKPAHPHEFATTHWSIVLTAGDVEHRQAREALAVLCENYWLPLYSYVRRRVADQAEAQDLTQAFFAELLEKNYVGTADPNRGRFRAFLLTAFKNFLSKEREKGRAQKRGAGKAPLSLDFAAAESSLDIGLTGGLTPEQIYDRHWAMTLLSQIMERLECEFDRAGKADQFEALRCYLVGDHSGGTYAAAAEKLGMTESAAKKSASRIRKRYRELLREEIEQTVVNRGEVDDEIRSLFAVFE